MPRQLPSLVCECHLQGSPVPQLLLCPDPAAPQNPTSNEGKLWGKQNPLPSLASPGQEQRGHGDKGRVAKGGQRERGSSFFSVPLIHPTGTRRMRSRCENQGTPLGLFLELIPCREEPGHSCFSLEGTQGRFPRDRDQGQELGERLELCQEGLGSSIRNRNRNYRIIE